jgi:hypothetical protein
MDVHEGGVIRCDPNTKEQVTTGSSPSRRKRRKIESRNNNELVAPAKQTAYDYLIQFINLYSLVRGLA